MFDELFSRLRQAPAAQGLLRRVELGGALTCGGVAGAGHAFLAAWLHREFPHRPVVLVAENLKAQETLHQDLETWLGLGGQKTADRGEKKENSRSSTGSAATPPSLLSSTLYSLSSNPTPLLFFPAWEILPHEDKLPHADVISERLETLVALMRNAECGVRSEGTAACAGDLQSPPAARGDTARARVAGRDGRRPEVAGTGEAADVGVRAPHSALLTTSITALLQRTFPPAMLAGRTRTLRRGERVDPLDLIEWLEENGYDSEAQVSAKGEIALRGGIVDVFPLTSPWPVRLEFFGDELESLRSFDPVTQVSREGGELGEIVLPPAGELGVLRREVEAAGLIGSSAARESEKVRKRESERSTASSVPLAHSPARSPAPLATLLDYLPDDAIVILCDPEAIEAHAMEYAEQVPDGSPFFTCWEELRGALLRRRVTVVALMEEDEEAGLGFGASGLGGVDRTPSASPDPNPPPQTPDPRPQTLSPILTSLEAFRPIAERMPTQEVALAQRREFFLQLQRWLRSGFAVHVVCNNDGEAQRFGEIWQELGGTSDNRQAVRPTLQLGALARGFLCEAAKFVVVTDAEVFGRYKVQRPRRMKSAHAIAARSALDIDFSELEEGDYVVHLQHGIGRFRGLKVLPTTGRKDRTLLEPDQPVAAESGQECLVLEYAPSDTDREPPKLYVPVTEAHLISKYVGAGKLRPPLNTLGGKRWEKTKQQAERAVRDVAADLLKIQAQRATQPGYAFGPDTPWQREFESSFLFEETADQLRAIAEAKRDLEIPKPMDRLVCGDVGFGKTEVAIRAAFKAVMGGKQVAILVPTTVLAQQHYNTFRERMADYPVRVELLSRFRTRKEQLKVVEQLAAGAVDIVIGTHRLVQSDVTFKDLGLVIIDEEQRFGVLHKEKFKLMRTHVDVLTLSATPIPRTLYLALTGARDMSTIQTPPQDRLPVETIVEHYDDRVIRDAIRRELERGGQVFFLHNRVTTIEVMRSKLALLVPNARIVVGHGQMSGDELEDVMTKFVNGEADVLLSTTIIESGLDIPNANTIIIDRADRFGLSQLYQLRGRVGRYKHQAFAYLLLPRHARLLTDVRKRMSAIKQYAQLGSGFKIAMRDLEIRGAGNLLGAQQSGHITAVGFELYCNLLKQSVATLKGEKVKQRTNAALRLDFLKLHAVEEGGAEDSGEKREDRLARPEPAARSQVSISVPREGGVWVQESRPERVEEVVEVKKGGAFLPPAYITEPQHRIEGYRKLAQAETKADVDALARELKDRYGPPPKPVELLLLATELKLLAGERGLDAIETKAGKLMLHRRGDYIQLGGKFPRLTKTEPVAVLKEIKKLLLSL